LDGAGPAAAALGRRLSELKAGSGRTYEGLSRRTGLSRSTLHRYCSGQSVPETFAPVEAIALACGANRAEIVRLFRLWAALDEPDQPPPPEPVPEPVADPVAEPVAEPVADPGPGPDGSRAGPAVDRRPVRTLRRLGLPVAVLLLIATVPAVPGPAPDGPAAPAVQTVIGPTWQDAPRPVAPEFFGVTLRSGTGAMPGFRVGSVRLWDGGTRWSQLEPRRGAYRWETLDRLVGGAGRAGLPVLFTFGGTPAWAAPEGARMPSADGARNAPPDRLEDWDRLVTAVSTRYRRRIAGYELWAAAGSPRTWSGSAATLAAMTHRARAILDRTDPDATVVCPTMTGLWQPDGRRFLQQFAALGGYDDCDAAGVALQPRDPGGRPEQLFELARLIDGAFDEAGVHPTLWATGTAYRDAPGQHLDDATTRNYALRLYLLALYGRFERAYFDNWGGRRIPIVLQAEGGPPTSAARALQRLQQWLVTARIYACGNGPGDGLPPGVWRCRFGVGQGAGLADAQLVWSGRGPAGLRVPQAALVRTLDGGVSSVRAGGVLTVGEEPLLVLYPVTPNGARPPQ
jgi:transcriptional regulator with XRE-family HTH domain